MALSTYNKKEDGVKMSVHVDDPLVIGPEGPIRVLFDWLGMRIAVKGLETLDSARGLKYLGMVYNTIPAGFLETTLAGYIEGMASMMGVMHAKTPTTPGFRTPHPTEADEKRWTQQDNECFAPSWARHTGSSEHHQASCTQSRSSADGCRGLVDHVSAKRMVKYPHGRVTLRWSFAHARVRCAGQRLRQPHREPWCGSTVHSRVRSSDTRARRLVVTRSRVLRVHSGSRRSNVR